MARISCFFRDDRAATAPEFALLAAVLFMGVIGVAALGGWSFPRLLGHMGRAGTATIDP